MERGGGAGETGRVEPSSGEVPGKGEWDEGGALPPGANDGVGEAAELAESGADVSERSGLAPPLRSLPRPILPFSSKTLRRSSMSCSSLPFDGITTY